MASTPPPATGDPRDVAWKKWAEGRLGAAEIDTNIVKTRVDAAIKQGSATGDVAANLVINDNATQDRLLGSDSNNRLARPIGDSAYWGDVLAGKRFVWQSPSGNSSARNVSWSDAGAFILQPSVKEGAYIDITPILATPASGKIYLEARNGASTAIPDIQVTWHGDDGYPLGELAPITTITSSGTVTAPKIGDLYAPKYSVSLVRNADAGVAIAVDPKVFEVIGTGGVVISPEGVSVEDDGGNKTVEINPTLPVLDAPNAPILTTSMGTVIAHWNGSLSTGPTPAHLSYVYAEEAPSSTGPWTRTGQPLNRAGDVLASAPVGQTRWYRFTAMDTSNRPSAPSTAMSIVVAGVDIPDLNIDLSGNLLTSALEQYVVSDSQTIPPGPEADWSDDTPDWEPGQFVWRRSKNTYLDGSIVYTDPAVITGADGQPGEDAVLLRVASSRGTSFKNNSIATVLTVSVFKGSQEITNLTALHLEFGVGAYLEWLWRRMDDTEWGTISSADPRLSQGGFALTVSPADVDEKTDFKCILHT